VGLPRDTKPFGNNKGIGLIGLGSLQIEKKNSSLIRKEALGLLIKSPKSTPMVETIPTS